MDFEYTRKENLQIFAISFSLSIFALGLGFAMAYPYGNGWDIKICDKNGCVSYHAKSIAQHDNAIDLRDRFNCTYEEIKLSHYQTAEIIRTK